MPRSQKESLRPSEEALVCPLRHMTHGRIRNDILDIGSKNCCPITVMIAARVSILERVCIFRRVCIGMKTAYLNDILKEEFLLHHRQAHITSSRPQGRPQNSKAGPRGNLEQQTKHQ